jgi:two-component system cell cycle response regulator
MENGKIRVLLVEDNPGDARLIREALSEASGTGFDLTWVDSLAKAAECLAGEEMNAILLDLSLPDSAGLETVSKLLSSAPETPIVVLTGYNDESLAVAAVHAGAQDYLVKGGVESNLLARSLRYAIERHQLAMMLRSMSLVDELTGLYNRRGFLTLAGQNLKMAGRLRKKMLLLFADLDGMKWINDNLGHHEGDLALQETAFLLKETFRESDIVARLGGDEFVVAALEGSEEGSVPIINRLEQNLATRNAMDNRSYRLAISIGVAVFDPESPCSIEELLEKADALMYMQKSDKKRLKLTEAPIGTYPD